MVRASLPDLRVFQTSSSALVSFLKMTQEGYFPQGPVIGQQEKSQSGVRQGWWEIESVIYNPGLGTACWRRAGDTSQRCLECCRPCY